MTGSKNGRPSTAVLSLYRRVATGTLLMIHPYPAKLAAMKLAARFLRKIVLAMPSKTNPHFTSTQQHLSLIHTLKRSVLGGMLAIPGEIG